MSRTASEPNAEHPAGRPAGGVTTSVKLLALLLTCGAAFYASLQFRAAEWQSAVLALDYLAAILYAAAVVVTFGKVIDETDAVVER